MKKPLILVVVLLLAVGLATPLVPKAHAVGANFDNIVVIAMENRAYTEVIGNTNAPFITSLLPYSSTLTHYNSYGAAGRSVSGCSAGCYTALVSGSSQGIGDGYGCCISATTLMDRMTGASLTWQAYCESGCPRGNDHFPFTGFSSTVNSPNLFTGSSVSPSSLIAAANSANPPSLLWFTPTDSHNMHDNSVASGDAYIQSFLVGSGSLASPAAGSLFASGLFQPGHRTLLMLWWDECRGGSFGCDGNNSTPNIFYGVPGTGVAKASYSSTATVYDEYSILHMIENNWSLATILSNDQAASPIAEILGNAAPQPLSASFTYSPTSPTSATVITFTGSAVGGTAPYSYSWNLGGTTSGSNPTSATFGIGTYTIALTVTDSASHTVTTSKSVVVTASGGCTSNCGGGGKPSSWPRLIGWGGIRMDEATIGGGCGYVSNCLYPGAEASCCFSGELATNMQIAVERMQSLGYNTVRVDFDPFCTDNSDVNLMSAYSALNMQRAITIASHYNFWIVLDYHGYSDMSTSSTGLVQSGYSSLQSCWLQFWSGVTNQFRNSYSHIIWEPLNEPCLPAPCSVASTDVASISAGYQSWITQTRAQGDTHWIVVQNFCSSSCGFTNPADGYPTVTDPQAAVFLSQHSYMSYAYYGSNWTNATADAYAQQLVAAELLGYQRSGWPILNTEGGADVGLSNCNGSTPLPSSNCSPDTIQGGSAGYSLVTLHFMRKLTSLYNTATPVINWILWPAGSWVDTHMNQPWLGALSSPDGWGTLLGIQTLGGTTCNASGCGIGSFLNLSLQTLSFIAAASVLGVLALGVVIVPRRRGK